MAGPLTGPATRPHGLLATAERAGDIPDRAVLEGDQGDDPRLLWRQAAHGRPHLGVRLGQLRRKSPAVPQPVQRPGLGRQAAPSRDRPVHHDPAHPLLGLVIERHPAPGLVRRQKGVLGQVFCGVEVAGESEGQTQHRSIVASVEEFEALDPGCGVGNCRDVVAG